MSDAIPTFPSEGFARIRQVLSVVPVSRSTWWAWVKEGRAPKPVKLSKRCTAWRVSDIRQLLATLGEDKAA